MSVVVCIDQHSSPRTDFVVGSLVVSILHVLYLISCLPLLVLEVTSTDDEKDFPKALMYGAFGVQTYAVVDHDVKRHNNSCMYYPAALVGTATPNNTSEYMSYYEPGKMGYIPYIADLRASELFTPPAFLPDGSLQLV